MKNEIFFVLLLYRKYSKQKLKIILMKYTIIFVLALSLVFVGCDDDDDTTFSSILGEWLVQENGDITQYRQYNVSIQRVVSDSALYKISNFYKTGTSTELYVEVDGYTINIRTQQIGNYSIQGTGVIDADYKKIVFEYEVTGGTVNYEEVRAEYVRN